MSGRAQHHERKPLASVSERGSLCTVRESVENEKKKKKKGEGGASQSEGAPQSKARGRLHPRARRGGGYVPEQWGRGCVPKCGGKGRGRRRGDGEARENDLESFVATRH